MGENLGHCVLANFSGRSANGCVIYALHSLPTTNPIHADKTHHVDSSVHEYVLCIRLLVVC